MKKIFLYSGALLSMLALAACDDSFDDWAALQTNDAPAATEAYGVTFNGSGVAVDMNSEALPDSINIVTATSSSDAVDHVVIKNVTVNGQTIAFTVQGATATVATADLDIAARNALQSQKYETRTLTVAADAAAVLKSGAAVAVSGTVTQQETPLRTPEIDAKGYYMLGDISGNSWNPASPLWMTQVGDGIYQLTVTTTGDGDHWYKFYEGSHFVSGDWDAINQGQLGCSTNGDAALFNYVAWNDVQTPVINGAGTWIVKLDVNNWTYTISKPVLYMAGNANGWQQIDYLSGTDGNYFKGFMYLDQNGFKFCTQQDWNGTNYGADFSTDGGAANITMTEPEGYYQVEVNLSEKKYTLTAITTIGIIGNNNDWNTDIPMTYNKDDRAWEVSNVAISGDQGFKFRANAGWDINWGGTDDNLTQGGANLNLAEGTYDFKLYAWADGFARCEITKK